MGNSAYHLARIQSEQGNEVTVFTPQYNKNIIRSGDENFRTVRLSPLIKSGNAALLPQIFCHLNKYEIVHLHYPFYGVAGFVLLKKILSRKKMKLVVHYHMDNFSQGIKGFIFKFNTLFILPLLIKNADAVISASLDYVKNSNIKNLFEKYISKFHEIPFGVDAEKFKPSQTVAHQKNILFVAGLDKAHYFKGLENLIRAFDSLTKKSELIDPDLKLNIIGNGDQINYYQKIINELDLDSKIKIFPDINNKELINFYRNADLFVLPSINQGEAFGLVLLEAMACGKPIIASNLPGVRNVFSDGKEGLLVEPDNIGDLTLKMEKILSNNELATAMGNSGRKLVVEKYDWKIIGKKINELYKSI